MYYINKLSFLLAFFISIASTYAQNTAPAMNKTTGAISRLKARSTYYINNGTVKMRDSAYYFYSGDNSWDDQVKDWMYDSVHIYSLHPTNGATYSMSLYQLVNGNIISKYHPFGPRNSYSYQSGKLSEIYYEQRSPSKGLLPYKKELWYYNSNGQITDKLVMHYAQPNWDSTDWEQYAYGPHGITSAIYKYNARTHWEDIIVNYTYTGGLLSEVRPQYPMSGRTLYYYNSNNLCTEIVMEDSTATNGWSLRRHHFYTHDNNGNVLTEIQQPVSRGMDTLRTTYQYNSYNQPVYIKYEKWGNQAWQPLRDSTDKYFYYEEVFPASIKEKAANSSIITLYPVPAAKTLTIDIAQQQAAELVFSIYTTDGKIMRQWNQPATSGQYKETISIGELPIGNYILKAGSNGTVLSKQFQVIR